MKELAGCEGKFRLAHRCEESGTNKVYVCRFCKQKGVEISERVAGFMRRSVKMTIRTKELVSGKTSSGC